MVCMPTAPIHTPHGIQVKSARNNPTSTDPMDEYISEVEPRLETGVMLV